MYDILMKRTAIFSSIFFVVVMGFLLYCLSIHNMSGISIATTDSLKEHDIEKNAKELPILQETEGIAYLGIPLSTTTKEDKIRIENNYVEQKIYITIKDIGETFYEENEIVGNTAYVKKILYEYKSGISKMELQLGNMYEHTAFYKNNMLYLEFQQPKEMYEKLIVIDARGGGEDTGPIVDGVSEKNITLAIMKKVKEKLDTTDIRAYYTRSDDNNPTAESRVALANLSKADMLISIGVAEDEQNQNANGVQAVYNPTFFIPQFGSVELADVMEREVARFTGRKAVGLIPSKEEDYLLNETEVPVAAVEVGYLTNEEERDLLKEEEYQDRVANGIYQGIIKAYQRLEEQ